MLRDFPTTQGIEIKVYFTDVFDIGEEEDDTTTNVMNDIFSHAIEKPFFDCVDLYACTYPQWREQKPILMTRAG